jgi:hypothetical protein
MQAGPPRFYQRRSIQSILALQHATQQDMHSTGADALNRTSVEMDSDRVERLERNICRNSGVHSSIVPSAWKLQRCSLT